MGNLDCISTHLQWRCMKCAPCKKFKEWQWTYRLIHEWPHHPRVWFVTLTSGSQMNQSQWLHSFQKYMKRIRKTYSAKIADTGKVPFRYFAVQELGSMNGRRHIHCLIFTSASLTKRDLEAKWTHGFTKVLLAKSHHAKYVSKYVTKSSTARILTSAHLGLHLNSPITDRPTHPSWYLKMVRQRLPNPMLTPSNSNDSMDRRIANQVIHYPTTVTLQTPNHQKVKDMMEVSEGTQSLDNEGKEEARTHVR